MSSFSGIDTFPSVELIIMLFPEDDLPYSFDISTDMVNILPSKFISQFLINIPPFVIAFIISHSCNFWTFLLLNMNGEQPYQISSAWATLYSMLIPA